MASNTLLRRRRSRLARFAAVAGFIASGGGCVPTPSPPQALDVAGAAPDAAVETSAEQCDALRGRPTLPMPPDMPAIATGVVDFAQLPELLAELEATTPEFVACGLEASALRRLNVVVGGSGLVEARLLGVPSTRELVSCPMVPQLFAMAKANGWVVEDAPDGAIRVRRQGADPLSPEHLDFEAPGGEWLYVQGAVGPSDHRVSVVARSDPDDEAVFEVRGPTDVIDAATGWCQRVVARQGELGLNWLGECRRPDPQALVIVPDEVDPDNAAQAFGAVRAEFFETFNIHGDSMLPGLRDGDVVFVDKTRAGIPPRGTTVVFATNGEGNFIKRVVGLPGERVELRGEGITVDGKRVEAAAVEGSSAAGRCGFDLRQQRFDDGTHFVVYDADTTETKTFDVPQGHVFVLGDNRGISRDSRSFGPIPVERILGRAGFIAWSKVGGVIDWDRATSPVP